MTIPSLTRRLSGSIARSESDKAWVELEKAQEALCDHEKALVAVVQERNTLNVHVAEIGALVVQAHKEAIQ